MQNLKLIIADNLKIEFCKTKKDYIIGLVGKSLVNKRSYGSKNPKIGVKAAECKNGKLITIYEYRGTKKGWLKLKDFTPTEVSVYPTKIHYKKQQYFHKDILLEKKSCELFFNNDEKRICSSNEAVSFIFEGKLLPRIVNAVKDLLNIPDDKLSWEELWEKQQLEMKLGICPI